MNDDAAVIGTADDAICTKYATVQAGYYVDPFLAPFVSQPRQCQPIIKKGTHARVMCIDRMITKFIESRQDPHIVLLGAGMDTNFFRYVSGIMIPSVSPKRLHWYEVDHPCTIQRKVTILKQKAEFFPIVRHLSSTADGICFATEAPPNGPASDYCLLGHDLRQNPKALLEKLSELGLNTSDHDILFLVECLQMYLEEDISQNLWRTLASYCPKACLVLFDPITGGDNNMETKNSTMKTENQSSSFGRMMEQNLLRANIVTTRSSLLHTRTLEQQIHKFVTLCGWEQAIGCNMWWAYQTILTMEQRRTAQKCEFLDEIEEWTMILQHYCILVASATTIGLDFCQMGPTLGLDPNRCQMKRKS
jgi:tRNA wybutosine-synthesizing protein 4